MNYTSHHQKDIDLVVFNLEKSNAVLIQLGSQMLTDLSKEREVLLEKLNNQKTSFEERIKELESLVAEKEFNIKSHLNIRFISFAIFKQTINKIFKDMQAIVDKCKEEDNLQKTEIAIACLKVVTENTPLEIRNNVKEIQNDGSNPTT